MNDRPVAREAAPLSRAGLAYGFAAYVLWGVMPVYFKQIDEVPAVDIVAHRIVWSLLVLAALALGREPLSLRMLAVAALFVMILWPEAVVGPSFQMSFAAVIAIVALHGSGPVRAFLAPRGDLPRHLRGVRPAVDRQAEGRLGDEGVAADDLERRAGGIGLALVVARHHPDLASMLDAHLG